MTTLNLTARQREILLFYESFIDEHGISPTLEEVAQEFGITKVTIFGHAQELLRKGYLHRTDANVSRGLVPRRKMGLLLPASTEIPILGRVAAGSPIEAIEDRETLDLRDLIPPSAEVFALRVQGESMIEDAIADGDIVLVERRSTARNGETVVAAFPDGDVTLKRFYREKDRIRLQPANSSMTPMYFTDVEVRGIVVSVVRRL